MLVTAVAAASLRPVLVTASAIVELVYVPVTAPTLPPKYDTAADSRASPMFPPLAKVDAPLMIGITQVCPVTTAATVAMVSRGLESADSITLPTPSTTGATTSSTTHSTASPTAPITSSTISTAPPIILPTNAILNYSAQR